MAFLQLARWYMFRETLLCEAEHRTLMWGGPSLPTWQMDLFPVLLALALAACLIGFTKCDPVRKTAAQITASTFLILLICMFASRLRISHHHLIGLVPLAALIAVVGGQEISLRWPAKRRLVEAVAAIYVVLAFYWNLQAALHIRSTGGIDLWSNAIDRVEDTLQKRYPARKVKVLDWGINNNLFVLSNGQIDSREVFGGSTVDRTGWGVPWSEEISAGDVFVLHTKEMILTPEAAQGFAQVLKSKGLPVRRTGITQATGAGYAEIVEVLYPNMLQKAPTK
jgi:hypothetical protein